MDDRVVILSRLPMLIIGYYHIFISQRTLQPIAVEIRFTVVSCCDLQYFSGFNPILEENIKIRKHGMPSWLNPIMKHQITDFYAFKSCSSCLLGVFRNAFTGWSTMTMFHQNDPSRKSKVVKTAWQKASTVTLAISVIYTVKFEKKRDTVHVFCHFLEWNFLVGTVLFYLCLVTHVFLILQRSMFF